MAIANLTPIGDGHYISLSVGAGSGADYLQIDDPPDSPDDATTYLAQPGPGTPSASAILSAFSAELGAITQVVVTARCYDYNVGDLSIQLFLRIGGSDYLGTAQTVTPVSTWLDFTETWTTNPATGEIWTLNDLAALEAGVKVAAGNLLYFTQIYATVTYFELPVYVVNSTTFYGVIAGWQRVQKRRTPDGITWQNYALHTWEIAQMEVSDFLILQGLQGQRLTNLQTASLADSRIGATYTAAEIIGLSGEQVGRRMVNVRVEFRVDVS